MHYTEAHTPWQNEDKWYIQEVKKMVNTIMDHTAWLQEPPVGYLCYVCGLFNESPGQS